MSPESGFYEWVVPNLSTRHARLALRDAALALTRASLLAGATDEDEAEDEDGERALPGLAISLSSEVSPVSGEFERTISNQRERA